MDKELPVFSVSEVANFIKSALEQALPVIKIVGEVSNFVRHNASGHLYFSLKDGEALIKAICFKNIAERIDFNIEDGMKLTITGKISAFIKTSNYQIVVSKMEKSGVGELAKIFEELKAKLTKEGLFDAIHKKPLPFLPNKIGLITAEGGAVLHDILKTLEIRFPSKIVLYKSFMQGVNTAKNVISGIKYFNLRKDVDVIIIARGGGSFEDLFEFNNEDLIRSAFNSTIPIISAIGHETDFTLLDFVADKRASTPTASIMLVIPSKQDILNLLENRYNFITQKALNFLTNAEYIMQKFKFYFSSSLLIFDSKSHFLQTFILQVKNIALLQIAERQKKVEKTVNEISFFDVTEVLNRGFSIVLKNGKKITSVDQVQAGDLIEICVKDGSFNAVITMPTLL